MTTLNRTAVLLLASTTLALSGCGKSDYSSNNSAPATTGSTVSQTQTATTDSTAPRYKHHSVLGGAIAGAAAGHVLGKHAVAGAITGAVIQHQRNKHQAAGR
ncbi:MAG: hypothetical protein M3Z18_06715 [Gemmatimonadota bacterium]|nr:hypothetical protein [Gemmatimonadota bacterium]